MNIKNKLMLFITVLSLTVSFTQAESVTLAWDPNSESNLAGYKVYYGTESRNYSETIDVGNITQYTITNLNVNVEYFFAVTAYNTADLESDFSEEISHTIPNGLPVVYNLDVSTEMNQSVEILLIGDDPNNHNLTFSILTQPTNGILSGTPPNITYTPNNNFYGTDSFEYISTDGIDNSNIGIVTLTINPVYPNPPINLRVSQP